MAFHLLHGNKKKETDRETGKLIYYGFRSFSDIAFFRAYLKYQF